jgi:hypothetical protein
MAHGKKVHCLETYPVRVQQVGCESYFPVTEVALLKLYDHYLLFKYTLFFKRIQDSLYSYVKFDVLTAVIIRSTSKIIYGSDDGV